MIRNGKSSSKNINVLQLEFCEFQQQQDESAAKWVQKVLRKKKECKDKCDDLSDVSTILQLTWGLLPEYSHIKDKVKRREDGFTTIEDVAQKIIDEEVHFINEGILQSDGAARTKPATSATGLYGGSQNAPAPVPASRDI